MGYDQERYLKALHAVQSGVATELTLDASSGTPKHLRTGINSALVNDAAIAKLLIDKGIITEPEYVAEVARQMELEQARFEAKLSEHFGRPIHLA